MKMLMENLTETQNLADPPDIFDYATAAAGFCPPQPPLQPERTPRRLRMTGRLGVSLLLSGALSVAEPAATSHESVPVNTLAARAAHSPHHIEHRSHRHLQQHKSKALAAVADHASLLHKLSEPAAHIAKAHSQTRSHIGVVLQSGWITNVKGGYYLGRSFTDEKVNETVVKPSDRSIYGAIIQMRGKKQISVCGWLAPKTATTPEAPLASEATTRNGCAKNLAKLMKRTSFGKDFNCPPHECVDGAPTIQQPYSRTCNDKLFYNYSPTGVQVPYIAATSFKGKFYDHAGRVKPGTRVYYRYTTLDGAAAVVRVPGRRNWVYEKRGCIEGHPRGGTSN